mgnify:CR=1 FL=1
MGMNCEHEYEVLHDGIQVEEIMYMDEGKIEIELSGYVIFHCKKCLNIQKKVL